jgi:predicted nucleic acid-binding protein
MGSIERETRTVKVLLDTNVILDVALERQPHFAASEQVLSFAEQGQVSGYISASTFSDLYYVIRKNKGRGSALDFLKKVSSFCQIATVDQTVISLALTANFKDFEDAIQHSAAVINHLDAIVTRNPQDFAGAALRIMVPDMLLQEFANSP